MPTSPVKPVPDGMRSITPQLTCEGAAQAIAFYVQAFGAEPLGQLEAPGGKLAHAQIRIGDSVVMIMDDFPEWGAFGPQALKGSPVCIHLYVEDVDAMVARAVSAGAKITMPVADMFWGDRYGQLVDPFGHIWSVATHVRDMSTDEIRQAMEQATPCNQPPPSA